MNIPQGYKLQIVLNGAVTTNQLQYTCSYNVVDQVCSGTTNGTISSTPYETQGNTNDTTAVDIVANPSTSTNANEVINYEVIEISVNNTDTANALVTLQIYNGTTTKTLFKATLSSGDQILYTSD